MAEQVSNSGRSGRVFFIASLTILAWIVLRAIRIQPDVWTTFVSRDNDDMMRLMEVRAWLAGQSWFDVTQYRLLPPEGVSMHWSRLVDLGLATILVPLSQVFSSDTAERLTLAIWPALLLSLMVLIVGRGTRRSLGGWAAIPAMASLILWLPIGQLTFSAVRIDHHNVQILMMTILAFALIDGRDAFRRGLIAGAAAAFALAVGLEMMPVIGAAGLMMALPSLVSREPWGKADRLLAGFCLALVVVAPLLFVAQTPPSAWFVPHCDDLASPTLSLAFTAALACLLPMLLLPARMRRPVWRIAATLALVGLGVAISAPLLRPCLAGPYGALPMDLQLMMSTKITEAQPGLVFGSQRPLTYLAVVLPDAVAAFGGTMLWLARRRAMPAERAGVVGKMLIFAWLGFFGSFSQIRAITMGANAVPFLTGFVIAELGGLRPLRGGAAARTGVTVATVLAAASLLFAEPTSRAALALGHRILGDSLAQQSDAPVLDSACRDPQSLRELDVLPPARILTPSGLGVPLILMTHHDGLTGPYHRSAAALWNGSYPFMTEANMIKAVTDSRPDYVALCRSARFSSDYPFAQALQAGLVRPWLQALTDGPPSWLVLKVNPSAMAPAP